MLRYEKIFTENFLFQLECMEQLTEKEVAHCITALCLYCRESVNRMKLRESNGLKLFVTILNDSAKSNLHERIINSLLQLAYDEKGLLALQIEGIVPSLIKVLNSHVEKVRVPHAEHMDKKDVEKVEDMDESTNDEDTEKPKGTKEATPEGMASPGEDEPDADDDEVAEASKASPKKPTKESVFRVNSPSYQAVQDEFEEFVRLRNERSETQTYSWCNMTGTSPNNSMCHSPDRVPFEWRGSSGYSPTYSFSPSPSSSMGSPSKSASPERSPERRHSPLHMPTFSPLNELLHSPSVPENAPEVKLDPVYSPIETFSDEDDETKSPRDQASGPATPIQAPPRAAPMSPETTLSPPMKRLRAISPPAKLLIPKSPDPTLRILSPTMSFNSFSPTRAASPPQFSPNQQFQEFAPLPIPSLNRFENAEEKRENASHIGWILQLLSRFSQAERPHEDMPSLNTVKALFNYLSSVKDPLRRAVRILIRLSK